MWESGGGRKGRGRRFGRLGRSSWGNELAAMDGGNG